MQPWYRFAFFIVSRTRAFRCPATHCKFARHFKSSAFIIVSLWFSWCMVLHGVFPLNAAGDLEFSSIEWYWCDRMIFWQRFPRAVNAEGSNLELRVSVNSSHRWIACEYLSWASALPHWTAAPHTVWHTQCLIMRTDIVVLPLCVEIADENGREMLSTTLYPAFKTKYCKFFSTHCCPSLELCFLDRFLNFKLKGDGACSMPVNLFVSPRKQNTSSKFAQLCTTCFRKFKNLKLLKFVSLEISCLMRLIFVAHFLLFHGLALAKEVAVCSFHDAFCKHQRNSSSYSTWTGDNITALASGPHPQSGKCSQLKCHAQGHPLWQHFHYSLNCDVASESVKDKRLV